MTTTCDDKMPCNRHCTRCYPSHHSGCPTIECILVFHACARVLQAVMIPELPQHPKTSSPPCSSHSSRITSRSPFRTSAIENLNVPITVFLWHPFHHKHLSCACPTCTPGDANRMHSVLDLFFGPCQWRGKGSQENGSPVCSSAHFYALSLELTSS